MAGGSPTERSRPVGHSSSLKQARGDAPPRPWPNCGRLQADGFASMDRGDNRQTSALHYAAKTTAELGSASSNYLSLELIPPRAPIKPHVKSADTRHFSVTISPFLGSFQSRGIVCGRKASLRRVRHSMHFECALFSHKASGNERSVQRGVPCLQPWMRKKTRRS